MFLSEQVIVRAIRHLKAEVHPFVGITFLACKRFDLPIGKTARVSLDSLTRDFLKTFHKLEPASEHYFQPYKSSSFWVDSRYPSSGLQTINTQTFGNVFLHAPRSPEWGFSEDYVEQIAGRLRQARLRIRAPLFSLAAWLYRDADWSTIAGASEIVEQFKRDFRLSESELQMLFRDDSGRFADVAALLTEDQVSSEAIATHFDPAPDLSSELAGALESMRLVDVGPAHLMEIQFGDRMTLITGDNGLGKSFLLECAWWAMTGAWSDQPAYPLGRRRTSSPKIEFNIVSRTGRRTAVQSVYDAATFSWRDLDERPLVPALAIFSHVDGSAAICDPSRVGVLGPYSANYRFTREELWNGAPGQIEGLVRDWVRWQQSSDRRQFSRFRQVLEHLSPVDLGILEPGTPVRVPRDVRDIPTIKHAYGEVPILFTSAGVQRILSMAYLLLWAWQEHELACSQASSETLRTIVLIVDELEAHLHPKWQRTALPALLGIGEHLGDQVDVQLIAATHSPMALASTEPVWKDETDVLYHLELKPAGVELKQYPYVRYGDVSSWLTSPIFELSQARSREAEKAIQRAKEVQLEDHPSRESVAEVTAELRRTLSSDDKFWPRWLYFAETNGVSL